MKRRYKILTGCRYGVGDNETDVAVIDMKRIKPDGDGTVIAVFERIADARAFRRLKEKP